MRCEECKYFALDRHALHTGWGMCRLAETSRDNSERLMQVSPATGVDGSLDVSPKFGCVQFREMAAEAAV